MTTYYKELPFSDNDDKEYIWKREEGIWYFQSDDKPARWIRWGFVSPRPKCLFKELSKKESFIELL